MARAKVLRRSVPVEQAVLLMLGGDGNDEELADALRGTVDWDVLLGLANSERASSELYRRVRALTGVEVPSPMLAMLQRLSMVSDFEMLHLEQCLRAVLLALESLDARVMLLKGAALVPSVYGGDFRRRPMADIDLLVDASRAWDVHRMLAAGQWQATVAPDRTEVYRDHHHLPTLRDASGSRVHLEIHTELFARGHPFGLTAEVLWAQVEPLTSTSSRSPALANRFGHIPAVVHQLLHACLHFAWSHVMRFGAWRAVRDVQAIVASSAVDWDAFVRVAREMRAATACYWTFRLAHAVADVRVPSDVANALRPPRPESLLRGLERHYVFNLFPAWRTSPSVRIDRALWEMGMLPSWSGHGAVRPWDRDAKFVAIDGAPPRRRRGADLARLWHTARYLSAVAGVSGAPRSRPSSTRPQQVPDGAIDLPNPGHPRRETSGS